MRFLLLLILLLSATGHAATFPTAFATNTPPNAGGFITNGQTLWVSSSSNFPAIKGRENLPWGSITGAIAAATSGDTIKLNPGEVFNMRNGQIRLPKNVSLDYSGATILSGGNRLQDGVFIVPGDNSQITGYGGTIGCTNDVTDELCPAWAAIGALDTADGVFTNVLIRGGVVTNASSDVFYVAQSEANDETYTMYVKDFTVSYERGAAFWDVLALGGDANSRYTFENVSMDIYGSSTPVSASGGYAAWLRWTSAGKLRLINVNLTITNAYHPSTYIVGIYSNSPPIEIVGGSYTCAAGDLSLYYFTDVERGFGDYGTNRIQWPPPNSIGYCMVNGAFISFGTNTLGTYPSTAADRLVFWDQSANGMKYATIGAGLTMTDTTLSASAGTPFYVSNSASVIPSFTNLWGASFTNVNGASGGALTLATLYANTNKASSFEGGTFYGRGAKGYKMDFFGSGAGSPQDATVYYIGGDVAAAANGWLNTTYANASIAIPAAGIITRFYVKVRIRTANGSNEDVVHTIRINDTTDVGSLSLDYDQAERSGTTTGLATSVSAGDTITIKITCPTWGTNPTGVSIYGWVYIE